MSIRSPSPPLPTFGIRGLAGPAKPPGIVSITKSQYDSTIRSTPDAKLLYLDDDDGELITVGSSFELSQRLDEPVVRHIPVDGKYVHIFDITHYSDSVAEWRDHEAYSSKTLRSRPGSRDLSSEDGSWPGHDFALAEPYRAMPGGRSRSPSPPRASIAEPNPAPPTVQTLVKGGEPQEESAIEETVSIVDGIGEHLSGLASVLQLAATTLQRAADKTRNTDTSVVEDILKGVKDILTEVGSFGIEAYKELNLELESRDIGPTTNAEKGSDQDGDHVVPARSNSESEAISEPSDTEAGKDQEEAAETGPAHNSNNATAEHNEVLKSSPRVKFAFVENEGEGDFPTEANPYNPSVITDGAPTMTDGLDKVEMKAGRALNPVRHSSILDDSSEDAAFTARYPPLRSIRRARSTIEPSNRKTHAYIPYRPKPETVDDSAMPGPSSRPFVSNFNPFVNPSIPQGGPQERQENNDAPRKPLPGAWPDAKSEWVPVSLPPTESSGAFFNRMTGRDHKAGKSAVGLHRANTTASSNPASRLNGPFDPGFPYEPSQDSSRGHSSHSRAQRRSASPFRSLSNQIAKRSADTDRTREDPKLDSKRSVPDFARSARRGPLTLNYTPALPNNVAKDNDRASSSKHDFHRALKHHRSVPHFQPYAPPPPSGLQPQWHSSRYAPPRPRFAPPAPQPDFLTGPDVPHGVGFMYQPPLSLPTFPPPCPMPQAPYAPKLKPFDAIRSTASFAEPARPSPVSAVSRDGENGNKYSPLPIRPDLKYNSETHSFDRASPVTPFFPPPPRSQDIPISAKNSPASWRLESEFGNEDFSTPRTGSPKLKNKYDACVEKLQMCGFGVDDDNLKNRLHVYAIAADGDIEEAVEMIEEDRKCSNRFD